MSGCPIPTHPVNGFRDKGAKNSLCWMPHYNLPGLNTFFMSNISNSDEAVQYYSTPNHFNLPAPYVTFSEIESRINVVLDLVNLKCRWKNESETLLKTCQEKISSSTLKAIKRNLSEDKKEYSTVPYILSRYTSKLMENPDQYFDSNYNWYFKNTIEKFQINGKWYLACARGTNLDILDIISISKSKFETIETQEYKDFEGPIFDIKCSNLNELMIRQKTKLFMFWNDSDTETLLKKSTIYDNCDIPLADADITANTICTADVKHVIKLWKDRDCIQNKYFDVVFDQTDSFIHLCYLQNQADLIAIINKQKLYLIDTRIDISKPCSMYDPNSIIEQCEELTALKGSCMNMHSVYVGSSHSVLTLDNRMGFVHKSYHMLSNPPSLINTHYYENSLEPNEMLLLGNQTGESLINLSYSSLEDDFLVCQNMASSIPKPLDTLHNVRLQGHCLNPILFDRFTRCLIGITVFGECIDDLRLFCINSAGDLFVQKINDSTPIDMAEFEKKVTIKSRTVQKLNFSQLFDMSKLWQLKLPDKHEENIKKNDVWRISKEKMTSYVDHLAPLILSPWDLDDLSEWENENIDTVNDDDDDSDCDYATKIQFWFNKNDSLLGSAEPSEVSTSQVGNFLSQPSTKKSPPESENDEDSSSGFTVSIKSDND